MFITTMLHRIFGKKTKKVEIAKDEKKLLKISDTAENFQSLATPSQTNAYELDLKLLKMRHQKNCKNVYPSSSLKRIKRTQHQSRSKISKSYSTPGEKHHPTIRVHPRLQPLVPKIHRVQTAKTIHQAPSYRYAFRRMPVIRRRKFPYAKK